MGFLPKRFEFSGDCVHLWLGMYYRVLIGQFDWRGIINLSCGNLNNREWYGIENNQGTIFSSVSCRC